MSKIIETGHDDAGGVSNMDRKITKEEFAKSLTRSLRQFVPILLGKEKPKGNMDEFLEKWERWAEEVDEDE